MKNSSKPFLSKLYDFLLYHEGLVLLLSFHLLLRIPNLFEPYWYGDEAIYLTIGTALRHGAHLYSQIVDHKTPIIYFLAMVPTQFWFRMLLIGWMSGTVGIFFLLTKNLKFTTLQRYVATMLFIIFTSLPWLEGNIPNGELFVMGFIITGAWFFTRSYFFSLFLENRLIPIRSVITARQSFYFTIAGLCFALGILTKVPALFDVIPFYMVGFFSLVDHFSIKRSRKVLFSIFGLWEMLSMAILTPLILSFVYFALRGSLSSYIEIGILYNFKYAGTWNLPQLPPLVAFLLTMKGKVVILGGLIGTLSIFSKRLSPRTQFLISWSALSLFGALLSSRPYPHYLLQVVPAFALLIGVLFERMKSKFEPVMIMIPLFLLFSAIVSIHFGFYQTTRYYKNFFSYISGQISRQQYYQSFDSLMSDNYTAAAILIQDPNPQTFIWGTNPTLYALSKKYPTGRFTVAFHIQDFPGAFLETYNDLVAKQPEFIVVMKQETIKFPEFYTYLHMNYFPFKELEHMTIYKRSLILDKDWTKPEILPEATIELQPPAL